MRPPSSSSSPRATGPDPLSLAGRWQLALDPGDAGLAARWHCRPLAGPVPVQLPGSLAVQRIGEPVTAGTAWTGTVFDRAFYDSPAHARNREPGRVRIPFLIQPETVFTGPAWYQREIDIPAGWRGRRIVLTLERPHWQTRAWLDEHELGTADSLSVPHAHELPAGLDPGSHRLTLRIDNRLHIGVGENASSVTDHTQGNWNGTVGRLELAATADTWIDDVQVAPHVASRSITVRGTIKGAAPAQRVSLAVISPQVVTTAADGSFAAEISLGSGATLWDEFTPALHTLTVTLENGERRTVRFGLREISTHGTQFLLNGRPIFLRGTVDCCVFPLTGHPPTDVESWRQHLRTVQAHGLNHVRFHSWCPPEAAFVAADELGVYCQVEASTWPNSAAVLAANAPAGIGDGAAVDAWTLEEARRIVRAYGNHPSFILMAAGNEPGGPHHQAYLARWLGEMRALDPRRLYTGASGWPVLPENQYHVMPEPRAHQWGDGLRSRLNARPPATTADYRAVVARHDRPVIAHEIGQWCAYPPLHDAAKYTGHLKARNYEIFAESLAAHGMAGRVRDLVEASGRLQAICGKEEIESALRTPGLGGFHWLALRDFPGQGTAPVGILDAFGDAKGYLSAAACRRFCSAIVPLARLAKRVFTTDETIEAGLEAAWFGPTGQTDTTVAWQLVNDAGRTLHSGRLPPVAIKSPGLVPLGHLSIPLRAVPAPGRCRLVVRMDGTPHENDWEVWIYPPAIAAEPGGEALITSSLTAARAVLAQGGRVLLLVPPATVKGGVALGFTPIFWNTSCTQGQAPHTLGLICDPAHPALAGFPTDRHANWQWWHLVTRAAALVLDELPAGLKPVVQVIDDWFTNRRLGLVFEARVGPGRLLACSVDLAGDLAAQPVARQLRASLVRHVNSGQFNPSDEVSLEALQAVLPR